MGATTAEGTALGEPVRSIGVSEVTHQRWRGEFGEFDVDQLESLKELEQEDIRLRRAAADLTLDKMILPEALRKSAFRSAGRAAS